MGWRDLLQATDEKLTSPWLGGRSLRSGEREWGIEGKLPAEQGWYTFKLTGRKARVGEPSDPNPNALKHIVKGYLVGDRIVPDDARVDLDPGKIVRYSEPVSLVELGLDRFVRVSAGRIFEDGPLIYQGPEMPLGPEDEVLKAFEDESASVDNIRGVPPALDAAFRMERWQRIEAARRRAELERQRREEEEKRQKEERRKQIAEKLGDGAGRREMAQVDFAEAAKAALAVGGAHYLDHRKARGRGEMVLKFRLQNRRFEAVCDEKTLRIIDSGICLIDHDDGDKKYDNYLTLESLPAVILEAIRTHKLVVFRHVD
jgi:hypothetical protein